MLHEGLLALNGRAGQLQSYLRVTHGAVRASLRKLLTFLLCLSLTPGWMELLENLEHLLHDGHLAHVVEHNEHEDVATHDALEAEHGCTPVSHICGCHSSIPAVLPDDVDLAEAAIGVVVRDRLPGLVEHPVYRANAPPVPPPRA